MEVILDVAHAKSSKPEEGKSRSIDDYQVETQIGHLVRRAHQRASVIFQSHMGYEQVTPTQFAALTKLRDEGYCRKIIWVA